MKLLFFLLICSLNIYSTAFSSSGESQGDEKSPVLETDFSEELLVKFVSYLNDNEVAKVSITSKINHRLFSKNNLLYGSDLRKASKFGVLDVKGNAFFLREFLNSSEPVKVSKVNNIVLLSKENFENFIELMLKSIPNPSESSESDLENFYKNIIKIDELIEYLPIYQTCQEKLAALMYDMMTWHQLVSRVYSHLVHDTNDYNDDLKNQVKGELLYQVRLPFGDQPRDLAILQLGSLVEKYVMIKVKYKVGNKVKARLKNILKQLLLTESTEERGGEEVKLAIHFSFIIYQLGSISFSNSKFFEPLRSLQRVLVEAIEMNISEQEAQGILENIVLPEIPVKNFLIDRQLKIIKRHLPLNAS